MKTHRRTIVNNILLLPPLSFSFILTGENMIYEEGELIQLSYPAVVSSPEYAGEIALILTRKETTYIITMLSNPRIILEVKEKEIERRLKKCEYGLHPTLISVTQT